MFSTLSASSVVVAVNLSTRTRESPGCPGDRQDMGFSFGKHSLVFLLGLSGSSSVFFKDSLCLLSDSSGVRSTGRFTGLLSISGSTLPGI